MIGILEVEPRERGKTVTHKNVNAGSYTMTLTVKDKAGNSSTDTAIGAVYELETRSLWTLGEAVLVIMAVTTVYQYCSGKERKTASKKIGHNKFNFLFFH
jgi:PKD repeat protein